MPTRPVSPTLAGPRGGSSRWLNWARLMALSYPSISRSQRHTGDPRPAGEWTQENGRRRMDAGEWIREASRQEGNGNGFAVEWLQVHKLISLQVSCGWTPCRPAASITVVAAAAGVAAVGRHPQETGSRKLVADQRRIRCPFIWTRHPPSPADGLSYTSVQVYKSFVVGRRHARTMEDRLARPARPA